MKSYKNALNRALVGLLVLVSTALSGSTIVDAQGRGRARGVTVGARPEINRVLVDKPAKPAKLPLRLKPQPPPKPKPAKLKAPKPPKPAKPVKPAKPFPKNRHSNHKRCVKACNRAHKNAIRACRGERGRTRAACERAANQAHRNCVRGCPR